MENDYFRKLPVREKWISGISLTALLALSLFLIGYDITQYWNFGVVGFQDDAIFFNFIHIIPIILTALFGYVYSLIMIIILFILALLFDINQAYILFLYLPLIGVVYFATKFGFFKSIVKTALVSVATAILLGLGSYLILCIPHPEGFSLITPFGQFCLSTSHLPECLIAYFSLYLFMRFVPDSVKRIFPGGILYLTDNETQTREYRASTLGRHVSMGLIMVLVVIESITLILTFIMLGNFSVYPSICRG